ncbi:MAG: VWA domain-containing protein [Pyrinomonadaceae bacterium]
MKFILSALTIAASLSVSAVYSQESGEIVRVETELAAFEVTVTDKKGTPIRNLGPDDFRIFEDGVERTVDFFQPIRRHDDSRPLSIVFALDVSGSMTAAELQKLRQALENFAARLSDYNSYFAVTAFGMDVKTLQTFTNQPDRLRRSLDRLERDETGLSTHAYDAVDDAIRMLQKKSPSAIRNRLPKRAVILITDGFPVGDVVSPRTVIERANLAETSIYSVILPSFSRLQKTDKPLMTPLEASGLVSKTGGKSLYATGSDLNEIFDALLEEVTSSYAVAIYPIEDDTKSGMFRKVRIEAVNSKYLIRQNRDGYRVKD